MKFSNNDLSSLNPNGYTRTVKSFGFFDFSRSTGYRLIKAKKFPQQIKISEGVSVVRNCDLMKFSADPVNYKVEE